MNAELLIAMAKKAMEHAYAPYSGFLVGAALLGKSGKIYTGCNIENASFSPTICAERAAFAKAVSEGEREFLEIAVTGGKEGRLETICPPCGVCRQVMQEFCGPGFLIHMASEETVQTVTLKELLPFGFQL